MNAEQAMPVEIDPRFPSGRWTGFYQQSWLPGRHTTNVALTFQAGRLWGEGSDEVGTYSMDGTYDRTDGRCSWTKRYHGKHSVSYMGSNEGHGIWGVWEIRLLFGLYRDRGVFHLWPEGQDPGDEPDHTYAAAQPHSPFPAWLTVSVLAGAMLVGAVLAASKLFPALWELLDK